MKIYQTSDVEHLCYNSKTIMKLTFVLFFAFMLSALANTFGQTEISINVKNKKIVKVLDEIEAKTDFKFIYRLDIFDFNKKVSLKAEKALIKDVLDQLFENKIVYYIRDTKVLLKQKDRNEVSSTLIKSMDQIETIQKSINGKVTDDEGNPLPGATII
jgi:hypothetical protein